MKQVLLVVLVGLTSMLMSCIGPFSKEYWTFSKKNPAEMQRVETHTYQTSHFFFPNKPNSILFRLSPPGMQFDVSESYEIQLSCEADIVGVIVARRIGDEFRLVLKDEIVGLHWTAYSCSEFNEFIRRLTSSNSEKCISGMELIFYTDESNTLHYIPSDWPLCLYGHDEKIWIPFYSVVNTLRNSDAGIGKWKDWTRPLEIFDKEKASKTALIASELPKSLDKRLSEKKQIVLMDPAADFIMVEKLDTNSYLRAFIEDNRVVYEHSEHGKILKTSEDADISSFDEMQESLNSYKTEMWEDSARCSEPLNAFYWNDENFLNSIFFHCETEKQTVWSLRKKIEGWFKLKLNMLEETEMNPDDSKKEPGN